MAGKQYYMNMPRWPVSARRFVCRDVAVPYEGVVSLTILEEVRRPLVVPLPQGALTVMGEGFHWIQLAPSAEHWWLTAMYDAQRQFVQFYFDITFQNHILPGGESWCEDAYLDVILNPDGTIRLLDEDELDAALAAGAITSQQYRQALQDARTVAARFSGQAAELEALTRSYLDMLLPLLPDIES